MKAIERLAKLSEKRASVQNKVQASTGKARATHERALHKLIPQVEQEILAIGLTPEDIDQVVREVRELGRELRRVDTEMIRACAKCSIDENELRRLVQLGRQFFLFRKIQRHPAL